MPARCSFAVEARSRRRPHASQHSTSRAAMAMPASESHLATPCTPLAAAARRCARSAVPICRRTGADARGTLRPLAEPRRVRCAHVRIGRSIAHALRAMRRASGFAALAGGRSLALSASDLSPRDHRRTRSGAALKSAAPALSDSACSAHEEAAPMMRAALPLGHSRAIERARCGAVLHHAPSSQAGCRPPRASLAADALRRERGAGSGTAAQPRPQRGAKRP